MFYLAERSLKYFQQIGKGYVALTVCMCGV